MRCAAANTAHGLVVGRHETISLRPRVDAVVDAAVLELDHENLAEIAHALRSTRLFAMGMEGSVSVDAVS